MDLSRASRWLIAALPILAHAVTPPATAAAVNKPNKPALASIAVGSGDMLVSITGRGFGTPRPTASVFFAVSRLGASQETVTFQSEDPAVLLWNDGQIVAKLPAANVRRVLAAVLAPGVAPVKLKVVRYSYETFDTSGGAAGAPVNGLVMDANPAHPFNSHRVFLNFEFHNSLAWWVPEDGSSTEPPPGGVQPLPGYQAPAAPIFRSLPLGNPPSQHGTVQSAGGDNAVVDSLGRVWFNEYGFPADPNLPGAESINSHNRLLAYEGKTNKLRVYNIPGDQQTLSSMAWDPVEPRMWFVLLGGGRPNRLVVFNPDSPAIPHDDFDFTWTTDKTCVAGLCTPLGFARSCQTDADCVHAEQVCPPGTTVEQATDCYLEIPLPPSQGVEIEQILRMVVHPMDGSVWMANYGFGTSLIRYDPGTRSFLDVPLPRAPGSPVPVFGDMPAFPAEIKVTPAGDILYQTQVGNTFGLIRRGDALNPSRCTSLSSDIEGVACTWVLNPTPPPLVYGPDVRCGNSCITETVLADGLLPCTPSSHDDPTCPWASGTQNGALYFAWIDRKKQVWFDIAGRGVGFIKLADLSRGRPRFALFPWAAMHPGPYFCREEDRKGPFDVSNLGAIAVDESNGSVWFGEYCRRRIARYTPID